MQRHLPVKKPMAGWTEQSMEELRGCCELCSDGMFSSIRLLTAVKFLIASRATYVSVRRVSDPNIKIYLNTKPRVTKEIQRVLVRKKNAFWRRKAEEKRIVKKGKRGRKGKLQAKLEQLKCPMHQSNLLCRHKGKKGSGSGQSSATRECANELKEFYCRFSTERNSLAKTATYRIFSSKA